MEPHLVQGPLRTLDLEGYTKGEHVLRFEAIVHNTKTLHTGRALEKFPAIVDRLAGMVDRTLASDAPISPTTLALDRRR